VIRFAAFAVGVVLIGSTDWALVAPSRPDLPPICATSEPTCEAAAKAIRDGVIGWEPVYTTCRQKPRCREIRDGREDCIAGFDCGGERR
jgi:hypothetical protein